MALICALAIQTWVEILVEIFLNFCGGKNFVFQKIEDPNLWTPTKMALVWVENWSALMLLAKNKVILTILPPKLQQTSLFSRKTSLITIFSSLKNEVSNSKMLLNLEVSKNFRLCPIQWCQRQDATSRGLSIATLQKWVYRLVNTLYKKLVVLNWVMQ